MYGLVATKGKEAGMPINKPWRAVYLNSSLGNRPNKKCDGSHIHTPCSGQNTSITEGYTPTIARIVHDCFRDDVRSSNFDVPKYASAAMHEHIANFDAPKYDSGSVPKYVNHVNHTAAICRLNPAPGNGAQSWANLPMASWTDKFNDDVLADPEDSATTKRRKGKASGSSTAGDANVEAQRGPWRALKHARFVPDLESKRELMKTLELNSTHAVAYEWLKHSILLCHYFVPGVKCYENEMDTIAILMRMLDPDDICGDDVAETVSLRHKATRASIFLGNVAGEMLCQWDTTAMNGEIYFPAGCDEGDKTLKSYVPFQEPTWFPTTEEELCHLGYDGEGHLVCVEHSPSHISQTCPWCQHRQCSLVESAKKMAPNFDDPDSSTMLVYHPLQAPNLIPKDEDGRALQVGHEGVRLSIEDEYGPLAR